MFGVISPAELDEHVEMHRVRLKELPFAEGQFRFAYFMQSIPWRTVRRRTWLTYEPISRSQSCIARILTQG